MIADAIVIKESMAKAPDQILSSVSPTSTWSRFVTMVKVFRKPFWIWNFSRTDKRPTSVPQ